MVIFQKILLVGLTLMMTQSARGQALSEFCFKSVSMAEQGIRYANQILLNDEKFIHEPGQNCAQIYLKQERFDLVDLFLRRKFRLNNSSGPMLQVHRAKTGRQHCRLEISETENGDDNQNQFKTGTKTKVRGYGSKIISTFQTTVVTMSGQSSEVMTPEGKVKIECSVGNSGAATIKVFIQSKLSSQILAMPGQTLIIGSLKSQKRSGKKQGSLPKGINFQNEKIGNSRSYKIRYTSF